VSQARNTKDPNNYPRLLVAIARHPILYGVGGGVVLMVLFLVVAALVNYLR